MSTETEYRVTPGAEDTEPTEPLSRDDAFRFAAAWNAHCFHHHRVQSREVSEWRDVEPAGPEEGTDQ